MRRVRARARRLLVWRALALLAGSALLVLIGAVLADFALRFPGAIRWVILLAGGVALAEGARRVLAPALRFRPSLSAVALRMEKSTPRGPRLASGVELSQGPAPTEEPVRSLHAEALASALRGFGSGVARGVLAPRDTRRAGVFALVVVVFAGVLTFQWPSLARTGAERVFMPWTDAKWPRRYPVADLNQRPVHAIDTSFPIRAALARDDTSSAERAVVAHYRVIRGEGLLAESTPERRVVLTDQNRVVPLPENAGIEDRRAGGLFERLIEPSAFAPAPGDDRPVFISYRVSTPDDTTPTRRVRLVAPPALASARAAIALPDYAAGTDAPFASGTLDLGTGTDERAAAGPVLAGSRVRLNLEFNKALPLGQRPAWAGALASAPDARVAVDGPRVTIETTLDAPARMPIAVTDQHGFTPRDPIVVSFDVVPDDAPEASITAPAHDEPVLATAVIDASAEGRDDLGVARVVLELQRARPPAGSQGAPPEALENAVVAASVDAGTTTRQLQADAEIDLARLDLRPGDEVRLWALALDTYATDGPGRDATRSRVRTLRVIEEAELVEQIRAELTGLRRTVVRLDEEQARLEDALHSGEPAAQTRDRQRALADRVALQRNVIDRLSERRDRNRLDDSTLEATLRDASALLDSAEQAARDAAERVPQTDDPTREEFHQAEQAQTRVRDELGRLARLLDEGQDGWLARRSVERLLDDQKRLREDTAAAGAGTVGRSLDQLDAKELSTLEQIAQRQKDAAERAGDAVDELGNRADALSESDPAQAEAMSSAEARARDRRLAELLEQAGDEIAQNQAGRAAASQDEAIEILEDLLEELDNAERARDSALRRQLASTVESIKTLVARQERELEHLQAGEDGLDQGMIRLNRNTLAVRADASQDTGLASVATLLQQAADAQEGAIVALRETLPDLATAQREENSSLLLLRRSLAEAERLLKQAEQREQDRVREELRKAYAEAAERQGAITRETAPLVAKRLSRRERADARDLGRQQTDLRVEVSEILDRTDALAEAHVFRLAHRRLDRLMTGAGESLRSGAPTARTAREQEGATALLASLAAALDDPPQPDSPFEDGQASSGGGQGQGGQPQQGPAIPPIHELMLLRSMQEQTAAITRFVADAPAPDADELADAATLQRSLAEQTLDLIQRMQDQQNPTPPPPPADGATEEGAAP